jgi:hypothetical protein
MVQSSVELKVLSRGFILLSWLRGQIDGLLIHVLCTCEFDSYSRRSSYIFFDFLKHFLNILTFCFKIGRKRLLPMKSLHVFIMIGVVRIES